MFGQLVFGLALAAGASAQRNTTNPRSGEGLHALAVRAGKLFFGTAIETVYFDDTSYVRIASNPAELGLLVAENSQKWQPTEPRQNTFAFANPDRIVSMAEANSQLLRCHTLTWFQQLPDFIESTAWTPETLTAAMQAHIANVVGHFKGQCHSWDVVNEALNDNGTYRENVFFKTLGEDYIPLSFKMAEEADPAAKLYYNDFSLEFDSNKTAGALRIVDLVRKAGQRIDGVGFQAHMIVGQTPSRRAMTSVLKKFTALDLEVALTELDVRHSKLPADNAALQKQADDYVSMVGACLDVERCVGVVVWGFSDRYSWIPGTFEGAGDACLFDKDLVKKPAYTSVASALAAKATGFGSGNGTLPRVGMPPAPGASRNNSNVLDPNAEDALSGAEREIKTTMAAGLGLLGALVLLAL